MTVNFETAEIPATVSTRVTEPNPFDGKFPSDDKALSVTVDGKKDDAAAKKLIAQARKAATAVERTARVKAETSETGTGKNKKTVTRLTFWTVPPITRPRKNGEGESASE